MRIQLLTMTLTNFKGATGVNAYEFGAAVTNVRGDNKTGKTTLADAFRWCLFGKNSEGKTNFGISPRDTDGNLLPIKENEVEVKLDVDGREMTLHRVYVSRWAKDKRVVGHSTNYFVNGDKYTEKEYKEFVAGICSEELFMVITNPMYFPTLPADQQRTILTEMVGEVSALDVAKGKVEFENLLEQFNGGSIEDYLRHNAYKAKEIKAELERIPVRISEQERELTEMAKDSNWAEMAGELGGVDAAIERIDEELMDSSKAADKNYAIKTSQRNAINKLKEQVNNIETSYQNAYQRERAEADNNVRMANQQIDSLKGEITILETSVTRAKQYLSRVEADIAAREDEYNSKVADFRERWAKASAEQFEYDENDSKFVCPTCHRKLEAYDIEEVVERMRENWNTAHAQKMLNLKAEANMLKNQKVNDDALFEKGKSNSQEVLEEAESKMDALKQQLAKAELELNKCMAVVITPVADRLKSDETLPRLNNEILALQQQLLEDTAEPSSVNGLKEDKKVLMDKRDKLKERLSNQNKMAAKQERIKELEAQEKQLNDQLTKLQYNESLANEFMEEQITMLEKKVNSMFKLVKFEMFEHKLNGVMMPKCECSINGVPYADLNNADRINAGIDIINAICKHNDIYAPCFVDNAESINHMLDMENQCINLIVSLDDKLEFEHIYNN